MARGVYLNGCGGGGELQQGAVGLSWAQERWAGSGGRELPGRLTKILGVMRELGEKMCMR